MHIYVHLKLRLILFFIVISLTTSEYYVLRLMLCFLWIIFWLSKILSLCLNL